MYNFSNSEPKSNAAFRPQTSSVYNDVSLRPSNFTPHSGAKKLVVKNLRSGPRLNQDTYFEKIWEQLNAALIAIFSDGKPDASLEELYKGGENVCRQGRAAVLAHKLQEKCKEYVTQILRPSLVTKAGNGNNISTLRAVVDTWTTWSSKLVTIRWIFYYLDQSFLLHSKELPVISEMGLSQFRTHVFSDPSLKSKILQGTCTLFDADRRSDRSPNVDSDLLKKAIALFHDLGVYTSDFEPQLLRDSETFFSSWAESEATGQYLANYAENSHRLIEHEVGRCELYALNRSTRHKLSLLLDENLITKQEGVLLRGSDLLGLMRAMNKTALERLYSLLERRTLGPKLKASFSAYIIEEGYAIVFDMERESEMVVRLLDFKKRLDDTWRESFHKNEVLGHTLREAFETFMNKGRKSESSWGTDNPKTGEMIAKYVDMLLKGGLKMLRKEPDDTTLADEDAEINQQLDKVLDLFRFVHGKAVFEAFYKNDLARRLLMGRSANDDAEKSMLARLKIGKPLSSLLNSPPH
jgi:hypothetical protein